MTSLIAINPGRQPFFPNSYDWMDQNGFGVVTTLVFSTQSGFTAQTYSHLKRQVQVRAQSACAHIVGLLDTIKVRRNRISTERDECFSQDLPRYWEALCKIYELPIAAVT